MQSGDSIAVIPARGGSKRIPRKNVRPFCGLPMIARSIGTAREAGIFSHVVVSTDNPEIADIARDYGALVPFERPATLADDFATTLQVMEHAAQSLAERGMPSDHLCCIYATAPFMRASDLIDARAMLSDGVGASMCVPVTQYPFPIQRALRLGEGGRIAMMDPAQMVARSQDLEPAWHDTGQFYFATTERWLSGEPVFGPGCVGLPIESWRVQDIDTPDDWRRAELLFAQLNPDLAGQAC